ncbi:MAG: 16S rRNA (guanine(527)-N(7))-methyltransferase RsmG [Treponemataceae bacterium]|nr:16S rRNA (guanine(527)-N(7))-methyltransferase RsmG [Treponemataceae bacterium]
MSERPSLLADGLEEIGMPDGRTDDVARKMDGYIRELRLFNSAYNLVNTDEYDEIVVRHIFDSLAALPEIVKLVEGSAAAGGLDGARPVVGDIGSGGGLPGIPLAAALPDVDFVLVERMDKRCAFLENAAAVLRLANVRVLKSEAERVPPECLDIAVFRAFRPLDAKMARTLLRLVRPGGALAAYKAKRESIAAEMAGVADIVPAYDVVPLSVPFLTQDSCGAGGSDDARERNLVVVRKEPARM